MTGQLAELLEHVATIGRIRELDYEFRCLQAWRRLAATQIGFSDGDRVTIRPTWTPVREGGWATYRECIAPGQVGTVRELIIDPASLRVCALTMWDTEWTTWTDGYGAVHREATEPDRRHLFYFPAGHLRAATATDRALQMATDERGPGL